MTALSTDEILRLARNETRRELIDSYQRIADALDTGTPNLVPPIAQIRHRSALIAEIERLSK